MKYFLIVLLFPILFAYAENIPDYRNPYAPILTDQDLYTWTDKVKITIIAPSWNTDQHLIDDIGSYPGHNIKISTRDKSLEPYRLTETGPNTGIFSGEVILTGFAHDVNGDKKNDVSPRTLGTGPTNGYLETDRDSSLTISFEFADGVVLTKSVPISWNMGEVKFLENVLDSERPATIQLVDRDLNLNPESIDHASIKVFSDSDSAGISIDATETSQSSGIFRSTIYFTTDSNSAGNRLRVELGDLVTAKYEDYTLPKPYSLSDHLEVIDSKKIDFEVSSQSISINKVIIADNTGSQKLEMNKNDQLQIVATVQNNDRYELPFVYLAQITNAQGIVVSLSWVSGSINPSQVLDVSQSWIPDNTGNYKVESFVWSSLGEPIALSSQQTISISIK